MPKSTAQVKHDTLAVVNMAGNCASALEWMSAKDREACF